MQTLEVRAPRDHWVTGGGRRRGGGEGVPSGTGHSPWRRAVRRIQTCASISVSMRCRRFFRDFMRGCCRLRRQTGICKSAPYVENFERSLCHAARRLSAESSQWMVLRCAGVVASRSASRTVVADFASTSSSIDTKPWSGPKLPRAPIDLEIAQQDAAQLRMIKRTRNEAGRLSACRGGAARCRLVATFRIHASVRRSRGARTNDG